MRSKVLGVLYFSIFLKIPITLAKLIFLLPLQRWKNQSSGYLSNPSKEQMYNAFCCKFSGASGTLVGFHGFLSSFPNIPRPFIRRKTPWAPEHLPL